MIRLDTLSRTINQEAGNIEMLNRIEIINRYIYWVIMLIIVMIIIIVSKRGSKSMERIEEKQILEVMYTIIPSIILIVLVYPWLSYLMIIERNEIGENINIKIQSYQWYWENMIIIKTSSGIRILKETTNTISSGQIYYNNEVEGILLVPAGLRINYYITSRDVIHSYGVAALGLKIDSIPGIINKKSIRIIREGIYRGSCYEGCGSYHYLMTITIKALSLKSYIKIIQQSS